jgi:hypothetical protein
MATSSIVQKPFAVTTLEFQWIQRGNDSGGVVAPNYEFKNSLLKKKSWSSGQNACLIFGRSQVQISARRPAILTDFSQPLQANSGIVL